MREEGFLLSVFWIRSCINYRLRRIVTAEEEGARVVCQCNTLGGDFEVNTDSPDHSTRILFHGFVNRSSNGLGPSE